MVKYLFLDIEWNAKDGSQNIADWEPIQVAAIGTDDKFNILKKFSKRVGLEDISTLTAKTCQLTHAKKEEVSLAKPACEVFKNFSITCSKYEFIVVWTRDTYVSSGNGAFQTFYSKASCFMFAGDFKHDCNG